MAIDTEKSGSGGKRKLNSPQAQSKPIAFRLTLVLFGLLIFVAVCVNYALDLPIALMDREHILERLRELIEMTRNAGAHGVVAIVLIFAAGVVVAAPSALMTYAATMVFGMWAVPVSFFGAILGLTAAFWISRLALYRQIRSYFEDSAAMRGVEKAVAKNSFWITFLLRQSPIIPFSAQNYMFGVLRISGWTYFTASTLGIIPGTLAKVYIFDMAHKAAIDPASSTSSYLLAIVGIGATIFVMWLISKGVAAELRVAKAID